jgi:hypothetical protein
LSKGRTGTGKTILSCGKAFRPTYVFNLEGRFESAITYYRKLDGHVKDLYYDDFTMGSGFYPLDKRMDEIIARPEYQTIVVSGLTPYIHIVLKHLMAAAGGNPENQSTTAKQKGVRKKGGIQVNILEDFNFEDAAIIFELLSFLQSLKAMGVNVILEAHIAAYEIKTINEDNGQREQQTIFEILTKGKKAPAQIPGYFNEVWLFEKSYEENWDSTSPVGRRAKYRVNTMGTPTDECKTSFGIPSFEWTGVDGSEKLIQLLKEEPDGQKIVSTARVDPNAPKVVSW